VSTEKARRGAAGASLCDRSFIDNERRSVYFLLTEKQVLIEFKVRCDEVYAVAKLRMLLCTTIVSMLLVNCGEEKSVAPKNEATGPKGVRIYLVSGSATTGEVYRGPVPNDGDILTIITSPTDYGFVKMGTIGAAGDSVYEFEGDYEYLLLLVHVGAVSLPAPFVRIDAIQLMENNMYFTGRTNSGNASWSSNDCDQDKINNCLNEATYWYGAPDGKYVALMGWVFIPVKQWAP
jgi:hypothetical protein